MSDPDKMSDLDKLFQQDPLGLTKLDLSEMVARVRKRRAEAREIDDMLAEERRKRARARRRSKAVE
jgi:hypothetical protein